MGKTIDNSAMDIIFRKARTCFSFLDKDVPDSVLKELYDIAKLAPTAANCQPLRVVFIKSAESKKKLKPILAEGNVEKTMKAPVVAILAMDTKFYEHLPTLFPYVNAKSWYEGNKDFAYETAFRNSSLQGAYFIIAARSLGLDCGPMSGFSAEKLNEEFFPDGRFKANFLCNLGYKDEKEVHKERAPRFAFEDACKIY